MDWIKNYLDNSKNIGKINSSTLEIYRKDLEDFNGFIISKDLIEVENEDIIKYIAKLKEKYSDKSVYRKMTSIRGFYKYLLKNRIIEVLPFEQIEIPNEAKKETKPLEGWEIKNILDVCDNSYEEKRDKLIIKLLVDTGLKIGDILLLEKKNFQYLGYKAIEIYSNSNLRNIELNKKVSESLKEFCEIDLEEEYPGRDKIFEELTRQSFRVRFKIYAKRANIKRKVTPSMIRKMILDNKLKDREDSTLFERIKAEYMRIGIGDE